MIMLVSRVSVSLSAGQFTCSLMGPSTSGAASIWLHPRASCTSVSENPGSLFSLPMASRPLMEWGSAKKADRRSTGSSASLKRGPESIFPPGASHAHTWSRSVTRFVSPCNDDDS